MALEMNRGEILGGSCRWSGRAEWCDVLVSIYPDNLGRLARDGVPCARARAPPPLFLS